MIGYIVGIVILLFIIYIISYVFNQRTSLSSFASASTEITIAASSIPEPTSTNYAYSIWLYIGDWSVRYGQEKVLMVRDGMAPQLTLGATDNTLTTRIRMANGDFATCMIPVVPIQKWTNIIVSVDEKALDTYINGKLVRTCVLAQPQGTINASANLRITPGGGFSGYTSRARYWASAISPQEAWNVYKQGPGGNLLGNFFSQYKVQLSFIKGTETKASITF